MSTTTTNYGLIKPDTTDPILIRQLNDNADAIDAALKENADAIENKPDAADIPTPSTAAPEMDGTGSAGTAETYARGDHTHPSDTSKQNALTTAQLAAVNSGIDSTKVAQIETNKNDISTLADSFGTKNLLNVTLDTLKALNTSGTWTNNVFSHYNNGIFTINSDLTIDVDTTNSIGNNYFLVGDVNLNSSIEYVLSGSPSGGARNTYLIKINDTSFIDTGNSINVTGISTGRIVIGVLAGTRTTLKYKPMVCLKTMWDISHTYQPYSLTNAELTVAIQAIQAQLANQ